jgi:hypothetical protein
VLDLALLGLLSLATPQPVQELDLASKPEETTKGRLAYQFSQVARVEVSDGRTRVFAESGALAPRAAYAPLRVTLDNGVGPRGRVTLRYRSRGPQGQATVSRSLELNAGERATVVLPIPIEQANGWLFAEGAGVSASPGASVYFDRSSSTQQRVLALGSPEAFEGFVGQEPVYADPEVKVLTATEAQAPTEPSTYLGFDAVVVPDAAFLERLDEAQLRALEGYALLGGTLVLSADPRPRAAFPLASPASQARQAYGFGLLVQQAAGGVPEALLAPSPLLVAPESLVPAYRRRYNLRDEHEPLLPQGVAPLGSFLLIMTAFTLVMGPGSLWVARRRGPTLLLLTIPATALLTCALIVGSSLLLDGFTVHAATYGYTLLDARHHRAVTVGLTAYYANLAPRQVVLPGFVFPIAPWGDDRESFATSIDWQDGARLGSDYLPSRVYREWGLLAVEPTRARIVLRAKGEGWSIQNAMGMELATLWVRKGQLYLGASEVPDGAERPLSPVPHLLSLGDAEARTPSLPSSVQSRFDKRLVERVRAELLEGEFLAVVHGQGFVPPGGVVVQHHQSTSLVRGTVEE